MRSPVLMSQSTTLPDLPPRPPPVSRSCPLRLKRMIVGKPSGKRQHAERLEGLGVVKEDLLLPADRDQRRPRTGRQRGERIRLRAGRTVRAAVRPASAADRLDARARRRRLARCCSRRRHALPVAVSSSWPAIHFSTIGEFCVGQLVALRRHLRIFRLLDALEEQARAGDCRTPAPCHSRCPAACPGRSRDRGRPSSCRGCDSSGTRCGRSAGRDRCR